MKRRRADQALYDDLNLESIQLARALIMEGRALAGDRRINNASEMLKADEKVRVKGQLDAYVSRGAYKLKKALEVFKIDLNDRVCTDIGSSTGGFTDVMLRNGAKHVYCVDVCYNLLDYRIRSDERVTALERTNARYLKREDLPLHPTLGVMDVSFISITKILPAAAEIMGEEGAFISLIKPQFEAGRDRVGKKGVVRDAQVHRDVIAEVLSFIENELGWAAQALSFSPIKGPEGNIEFLVHILPKSRATHNVTQEEIDEVVKAAHESLHEA